MSIIQLDVEYLLVLQILEDSLSVQQAFPLVNAVIMVSMYIRPLDLLSYVN